MCRLLAYSGDPVFLDELLFKPEHSLIEQSRSSYSSTTPTNADGYGVGWYGERETPGLYRSIRPAWTDRNLRDLSEYWLEIRPSSSVVIDGGGLEIQDFKPRG